MSYYYVSDLQLATSRHASPRVLYFVILCLVSYILIDFVLHHSGSTSLQCTCGTELILDGRSFRSSEVSESDLNDPTDACGSVLGHLYSGPQLPVAKAWNQMKWIGAPARCKVKGQLIESLDEVANFRRGFALKFTDKVGDKTMILPWLYGAKVDLNRRPRRVYLDLGANNFHTSVEWFSRMYPCDFTEVHAFEKTPELFRIPQPGFDEETNWISENSHAYRVKEVPQVPDWMVERIKLYNTFVADADGENAVNITRFIKEELKLTAEDAVVVKMDIEDAEWPILQRWLFDPEMAEIIDELFVEIHYRHITMRDFDWEKFTHSREEATKLIASLRAKGFFVHAWP